LHLRIKPNSLALLLLLYLYFVLFKKNENLPKNEKKKEKKWSPPKRNIILSLYTYNTAGVSFEEPFVGPSVERGRCENTIYVVWTFIGPVAKEVD